jgi:hypothetical protein
MAKFHQTRVAKIVLSCVVLAFVGCASTTLKNSWRDPSYKGPPLKKVMVVGVSNQPVTRRTFEDEFVKQLKANGVEGIQSYNFIAQDGKAEEAQVKQAVQKAGADGALITRLVRVDVNVQVVQPMGFYGGYGGYAGAWGGYYDPPMVSQTDTVVLETTLWGLNDSVLLWSGSTETFAPSNIRVEMENFAKVIIGALKKQKLI